MLWIWLKVKRRKDGFSEAGRKMAEHGVQAAVVRRNFAQALAVAFSKFNASHALPAAMERSFARKVAEIYEQPHWSALKRHLDGLIDLWMQTRERQTADILVKKMLDFIHRHLSRSAQAGNDGRTVSLQQCLSRQTVQGTYRGKLQYVFAQGANPESQGASFAGLESIRSR